jgi:hypothetical protein
MTLCRTTLCAAGQAVPQDRADGLAAALRPGDRGSALCIMQLCILHFG